MFHCDVTLIKWILCRPNIRLQFGAALDLKESLQDRTIGLSPQYFFLLPFQGSSSEANLLCSCVGDITFVMLLVFPYVPFL